MLDPTRADEKSFGAFDFDDGKLCGWQRDEGGLHLWLLEKFTLLVHYDSLGMTLETVSQSLRG